MATEKKTTAQKAATKKATAKKPVAKKAAKAVVFFSVAIYHDFRWLLYIIL